MNKIELIGQIADLKESNYKTNLLLASLIELLTEKHVLNKTDLSLKAQVMDLLSELEIRSDSEKREHGFPKNSYQSLCCHK